MTGVIRDHLTAGDLWVLDLLIVAASTAFGLAAAQTVTRDNDPDESTARDEIPHARTGDRTY